MAERSPGWAGDPATLTHLLWAALTVACFIAWILLHPSTFTIALHPAAGPPQLNTVQPHQPQEPLQLTVLGLSLRNRSHGFNHHIDAMGPQCSSEAPPSQPAQDPERRHLMQYTPNRAWPNDPHAARTLLVLAIDDIQAALDDHFRAGFATWLTQLAPAIAPTTAMALILDKRYCSDVRNVTRQLGLQKLECGADAISSASCKVAAGLDQGYELHAAEVNGSAQFVVFVGVHALEVPYWVQRAGKTEAGLVEEDWHTSMCTYQYRYWKMTSWYQLAPFRLQLADFFDFFLKLDDDVFFPQAMPFDPTPLLARNRTLFMQTWVSEDSWECQGEVQALTLHHLDMESDRCGYLVRAVAQDQEWFQSVDHFYWFSNFVAGWLGFFTSPEQLRFAAVVHNSPYNHIHRWADQGYFTATVGMFHDGSRIMDLSYLREQHVFCHKVC